MLLLRNLTWRAKGLLACGGCVCSLIEVAADQEIMLSGHDDSDAALIRAATCGIREKIRISAVRRHFFPITLLQIVVTGQVAWGNL